MSDLLSPAGLAEMAKRAERVAVMEIDEDRYDDRAVLLGYTRALSASAADVPTLLAQVQRLTNDLAVTEAQAIDRDEAATSLARQVERVRALHVARSEEVIPYDCSEGDCEHGGDCPTMPFEVCVECYRIGEESDVYFGEGGIGHVAHPCPTIRALDTATTREDARTEAGA